jgi:taurine dioxygenase
MTMMDIVTGAPQLMDQDITVRRLGVCLGAEITGVDLRGVVPDDVVAAIRGAFLEHQVLCIRGQEQLTPDDQLAFAARWGEVSVHPYVPSIEGYPGVMRIYDPNPITQTWHADTTHNAQPPALTFLLARALPEVGGDTMFSSMYRVFESLSPGLQATLETLRAVHQGTERAADAGLGVEAVTTTHPVVRVHPETGRKALFVNGNYVTTIEGWTPEESAPLLSYLYSLVGQPEMVYRHRWRHGDLVIWDNRCTQHAVVGDTDGTEERTLHRVTIAGDTPV